MIASKLFGTTVIVFFALGLVSFATSSVRKTMIKILEILMKIDAAIMLGSIVWMIWS